MDALAISATTARVTGAPVRRPAHDGAGDGLELQRDASQRRTQERDVIDTVEQRYDDGTVQQRRGNSCQGGQQVRCLDRDEEDIDRRGEPWARRDRTESSP